MELHFTLWQHIPYASILLPLASAALTSVMKPPGGRALDRKMQGPQQDEPVQKTRQECALWTVF